MKKFLSTFVIFVFLLSNSFSITRAVPTDERAAPWTREKATHLAQSVLFHASPEVVDMLFSAGSATAAVNLLFPDPQGPDRTEFNNFIANYTSSGFNWGDANHTTRLYQLIYAADPYEAKRKLFSLFEDIYAINANNDIQIGYRDVYDLHTLLFDNMLGNYQTLVKRALYNNGNSGDYAESKFLDLLNQMNPNTPNENYAREILQLFLMGEYRPHESKENENIRNYEESDVLALAKILTGLRSDPITHAISFDINYHYTGSMISFLSGTYLGNPPAYYNSASGTIDPIGILNSIGGNNGFTDNVVEYIFAKRSHSIALFLADRIVRFYMYDTPTRTQLDVVAAIIESNNFEILPSLKAILSLDIMYSDVAMNSLRYKNPLELTFGTIRQLRKSSFTEITADPNVFDTSLLRRLGWTPYFAGSVFGRDGFDNSLKWSNTSTQGAWMSATNYFTYRITGTGVIDFLSVLPKDQKKELTTENIFVMTHANNSYTGNLIIFSGSLELAPIVTPSAVALRFAKAVATFSSSEPEIPISIEEQILNNGYALDPVVAIEGGENLNFIKSQVYDWDITPAVLDEIISDPATNIISLGDVKVGDNPISIETNIPPSEGVSSGIFIMTGNFDSGATDAESTDSGSIIVVEEKIGTIEKIQSQIIISADTLSGEGIVGSGSSDIQSSGEVFTGVLSPEFSGAVGELPVIISETISGSLTDTFSGSLSEIITENSIDVPVKSLKSVIANLSAIPEIPSNVVTIISGSVIFPNFRINTNLGLITLSGGTYNASTKTLNITSGILTTGGSGMMIVSGTIIFTPDSRLISDTISADVIVNTYENFLFGSLRFPTDVKTLMVDFISKDSSGNLLPIAPTNTQYFNKYIRGLLSIMLAQPEYVLMRGYDLPTVTDTEETRFLDSITGKLFIVELYGGNDYLTSIIPKDEYSTYLNYRTNSTGSIAIAGTGLVDIGDFYMNSALAYNSGTTTGFKDLYDQGYMKFFNRVGGYRHSSDHDAAAKQISSYNSTTSSFAEGVFGHLVKKELESSHTISLGARNPNVYRSGHYVNLGGNIILTNPLDSGSQWKTHMDAMVNIGFARSYPLDTKNLFRDAGRISEIGKISVAQGGAPGASGNMTSVFNFAKILMNNDIGRTFYMGGAGGYDTHGNQFNGLNTNLATVSAAVTNFFNQVKDTKDVTVIIFSEFGRTNRTNGDLGTDHGDGGGMYVVTSNQALRTALQSGVYGNQSIKYAKNNSLGVGIDYRSVYGLIFKALYNLDPSTYFASSVDLFKDISMEKNTVSLYSKTYQISGQNVSLGIELTISGSNFNPGKAGYTRLLTNTGISLAPKITRLNEKIVPEGYQYTMNLNPITQPYYTIESFSNQYAITALSGALIGVAQPLIIPNTSRNISQAKTSILALFGNTAVPSTLAGSGIIIENTGSTTLSIPENPSIRLHFQSGATRVTGVTYFSGSTTWRGGFILGEKIEKDLFLPETAILVDDNRTLPRQNVSQIMKLGADRRGVGMQLNQSLGLEFTGLTPGLEYRVISSEDGIRWSDIELSGKKYSVDVSGSIIVMTNHFSYFALLSTANIIEAPPTCIISANPGNAINGTPTLLTWSLQNTQTGILNPGVLLIGSSGSLQVTPPVNATTSYNIMVSNGAGSNSCSVPVVTTPLPPIPPPFCSISSNPSVVVNGSGTVLSWSSVNANTGVINPGNIIVPLSGSQSIIPPDSMTTRYTLSVSNSGGTTSCDTGVTSSILPPAFPLPICTVSIFPSVITNGSNATLIWTIQNAATGILNPGNTHLVSNGSVAIMPIINATTTYNISTVNASGTGTCSAQVQSVPPGNIPITTSSPPPFSMVGPGGGGNSYLDIRNTPPPPPSSKNTLSESEILSPITNIEDFQNRLDELLTSLRSEDRDNGNLSLLRELLIDIEAALFDYNGDKQSYKNSMIRAVLQRKIGQPNGIQSSLQMILSPLRRLKVTNISSDFGVSEDEYEAQKDEIQISQADENIVKGNNTILFTADSAIKYISIENSVNLRTTPILSDLNIMRTLSRNTRVELLQVDGIWSLIRDENGEGYVKTAFLRDENSSDLIRRGELSPDGGEQGIISVERSLFIREKPTILSDIVGVLYSNDSVVILDRIGKWVEILTTRFRGFISGSYVK